MSSVYEFFYWRHESGDFFMVTVFRKHFASKLKKGNAKIRDDENQKSDGETSHTNQPT